MKRSAVVPVVLAAALLAACVELLPAVPELREDYMGKWLFEPGWEPQVERDELGQPEID